MQRAASLFAALVAPLLLIGLPLQAQVLYKWTDAEGRTQYSDQPPKNFKGEVTRLEPPDAMATPTPAAPAKAPAPEPERASKPAPPDRATQRRTSRNALWERLDLARTNLARARKALDEAGGPEPDERQVVQQEQRAGAGGMHGLSVQRSNCSKIIGKDGKPVMMCPAMVPNDSYFERVTKLEDAVKRAENELDEAEQAYRRGVD